MLDFNLSKDCYSCGACLNVCPKSAIKMQEDSEGFLRPVIDESKCIKCGLCEKKCIHLNKLNTDKKLEESKCYALKLKDNNDILKSASGGAFFEIAKKFIEDR